MGRYDWKFEEGTCSPVDFCDKSTAVFQYVLYMLDRTQSIFKYTGLPDTLPQRMLEIMLQTNGWIVIPIPSRVKGVKGNIYAFAQGAGLGGEQDVYYRPTICTVASPALRWSDTLKIGEECIVIPNDSMFLGLLPMFRRYATQLTENDITMYVADINNRIMQMITADNDQTEKAAKSYVDDVIKGKIGVAASKSFFEGIKTQPYAVTGSNQMSQLIEYQQYLKAGWYNDLGLNANYNMKREAINSDEAQLNDDALLPFVNNMLLERQKGFDEVNRLCGTNIHVELSSAWKIRQKKAEMTLETLENPPSDNSTESGKTAAETGKEEAKDNAETN